MADRDLAMTWEYHARIQPQPWRQTMKRILPLAAALIAIATAQTARADFMDELKKAVSGKQASQASTAPAAALTQTDMVGGLKEALAKGAHQAIAKLGKTDGFLKNAEVAIPMPESLKKIDKLMRKLGQDKMADEFVATMNHAAEKAVPEAASLFGDAISQMTVQDAQAILKGPDNAATEYFRKTSGAKLAERFKPIVQAATDKAGVTNSYKALIDKAGPLAKAVGKDTDLDSYVTDKTVDGLFKMIAVEEKLIRQDPVARTTDLLKKVFGSILK
jgi:hypothetical protein